MFAFWAGYILVLSFTLLQDEGHDKYRVLDMIEARRLYYASIEDKTQVDPAIRLFEEIQQNEKALYGRAQVYIGGLHAIKGKHAFWPHAKVKWVNRSLKMMDEGIRHAPEDLEARFVRGAINDNLPFFFGRTEEAKEDFHYLLDRLPTHVNEYDREVVLDIVNYLIERWDGGDISVIRQLKERLNDTQTEAH